jgi:hypothetical protein
VFAVAYVYFESFIEPLIWVEPGSPDWFDDRQDMIEYLINTPYVAAMAADPKWEEVVMPNPDSEHDHVFAGFALPEGAASRPSSGGSIIGRGSKGSAMLGMVGGSKHHEKDGDGKDHNLNLLSAFSTQAYDPNHYLAVTTRFALPVWMYCRHKETGETRLIVVFGETSAGWPGIVHGGYQASVMLELMRASAAHVAGLPSSWEPNMLLEMTYRSPVRVGVPYVVSLAPPEVYARLADDAEDDATRPEEGSMSLDRIKALEAAGRVEKGVARATIEPLPLGHAGGAAAVLLPSAVHTQAELLWSGKPGTGPELRLSEADAE